MPETSYEPPSPDQLSSEEQELAALFRSAGAGDRVADDELRPIKAKAREAWRRQVRLTAARRGAGRAVLAIAAAVVLVIAVALLRSPRSPVDSASAATLEAMVGDTTIDHGRATVSAGPGIESGATITTGGSGRAALLLASGHSIRIDVGSTVAIVSGRALRLERGAVYVDARDADRGVSTLEIATPLGLVTDIGTRFEVRLLADAGLGGSPAQASAPQALEVRVRDGAVRLTTEAGSYDAEAGSELHLERGGGLERAAATPYGDRWSWIENVRPPIAIDGMTCEAFLDWASRESGRRWRFADQTSRDGAGDAVIHGSIEGLTVEDSLSIVLPSCGWRHRVEGDELLIESEGS
jgi:hypothetical protein